MKCSTDSDYYGNAAGNRVRGELCEGAPGLFVGSRPDPGRYADVLAAQELLRVACEARRGPAAPRSGPFDPASSIRFRGP